MNNRKIILALVIFCFVVNVFILLQVAGAATINVAWNYTPEEQAKINKFRIFNQDHTVTVTDIPAADRVAAFNAADECGGWYIVAVAGDGDQEIESDPSNIISWCPPAPDPPPAPGVFSVSGTIPGTLKIEAVQ